MPTGTASPPPTATATTATPPYTRFAVTLDDPDDSWFSFEIWVYDVPADADYRIEIIGPLGTTVATADTQGLGGDEAADWGGIFGWDDGGRYEIVVRSNTGARCDAPCTLQILTGGW